jgi:chemotaxis protein CheD
MIIIKVGMADLKTSSAPNRLKTLGLGSCVGLTLYDPKTKAGGMAHVMLPSSDISRDENFNIAKYADTAIPELIRLLEEGCGAKRLNLIAKMVGGAQMFAFASGKDHMRIGPRNVEACKNALNQFSISLTSEETGGSIGRTIELDIMTGQLHIWTVRQGAKTI